MLREFFTWWLEQLADLLPQGLRGAGAGAGDALIISPVGALPRSVEALAVSLRRGGKETPLRRFGLGASGLAALPGAAGKPVVLRLSGAQVLTKTIILPGAAERDLGSVLAFEMDRETPFGAEEVYWNHRIESRQSGRLFVRLLLLPKAMLAPLIAALAEKGLAPRRAEIADGPDRGGHLPLDGNGGRLDQPSARLVRWAAALCALLALGVVVTPFLRQSAALAAVDREITAERVAAAEAGKLRREIASLSGGFHLVARQRDEVGRPLEVLAAATRILPDDTYLTELILRRGKLTLGGRSAAAARLIGALAASHQFRNPAFGAPVTHIPTLHVDVFTIVAEVAP
jgi:general secretion pathway protein L